MSNREERKTAFLALVGERIKSARQSKQWSMRELGEVSGVSHDTIHKIEGGNDTKLGTVITILHALELTPRQVFDFSAAEKTHPVVREEVECA